MHCWNLFIVYLWKWFGIKKVIVNCKNWLYRFDGKKNSIHENFIYTFRFFFIAKKIQLNQIRCLNSLENDKKFAFFFQILYCRKFLKFIYWNFCLKKESILQKGKTIIEFLAEQLLKLCTHINLSFSEWGVSNHRLNQIREQL